MENSLNPPIEDALRDLVLLAYAYAYDAGYVDGLTKTLPGAVWQPENILSWSKFSNQKGHLIDCLKKEISDAEKRGEEKFKEVYSPDNGSTQ